MNRDESSYTFLLCYQKHLYYDTLRLCGVFIPDLRPDCLLERLLGRWLTLYHLRVQPSPGFDCYVTDRQTSMLAGLIAFLFFCLPLRRSATHFFILKQSLLAFVHK